MKKLFIILVYIFGFNLLQAQLANSDFQHLKLKAHYYTFSNQKTLFNNPDSLYKGHNMSYYQDLYKTGNIQRFTGLAVTIAGVAQWIPAGFMLDNASLNGSEKEAYNLLFGLLLAASGTAAILVGVSITISGQVKRSKSKKAIEHLNRNISLSFRTTNNGVGLVLKF